MYDWINKKMRAKHFTLAQWRKMKVGDVIEVAIFDRNFTERFIWDNTTAKKVYKPGYLFRMNHHAIKKTGPMTYNIGFRSPRMTAKYLKNMRREMYRDYARYYNIKGAAKMTDQQIINRLMKAKYIPWKLKPENDGRMIEVSTERYSKGWEWCPLTCSGKVLCSQKVSFEDIPGDVRLGWRGPIILWSDVKKAPDVYWKDPIED